LGTNPCRPVALRPHLAVGLPFTTSPEPALRLRGPSPDPRAPEMKSPFTLETVRWRSKNFSKKYAASFSSEVPPATC
jgi:hypothetical protein